MSDIDKSVVRDGTYPERSFTILPNGFRVGNCGDIQNIADAQALTRTEIREQHESYREAELNLLWYGLGKLIRQRLSRRA